MSNNFPENKIKLNNFKQDQNDNNRHIASLSSHKTRVKVSNKNIKKNLTLTSETYTNRATADTDSTSNNKQTINFIYKKKVNLPKNAINKFGDKKNIDGLSSDNYINCNFDEINIPISQSKYISHCSSQGALKVNKISVKNHPTNSNINSTNNKNNSNYGIKPQNNDLTAGNNESYLANQHQNKYLTNVRPPFLEQNQMGKTGQISRITPNHLKVLNQGKIKSSIQNII